MARNYRQQRFAASCLLGGENHYRVRRLAFGKSQEDQVALGALRSKVVSDSFPQGHLGRWVDPSYLLVPVEQGTELVQIPELCGFAVQADCLERGQLDGRFAGRDCGLVRIQAIEEPEPSPSQVESLWRVSQNGNQAVCVAKVRACSFFYSYNLSHPNQLLEFEFLFSEL